MLQVAVRFLLYVARRFLWFFAVRVLQVVSSSTFSVSLHKLFFSFFHEDIADGFPIFPISYPARRTNVLYVFGCGRRLKNIPSLSLSNSSI